MTQHTISSAAKIYEPKKTKNITELKSIDVNLVLKLEKGFDDNGEEYEYNYIEVNEEKYRVPDSVLMGVKSILEKKPTLKMFCVSKTGEGRNTRYTVIPLD